MEVEGEGREAGRGGRRKGWEGEVGGGERRKREEEEEEEEDLVEVGEVRVVASEGELLCLGRAGSGCCLHCLHIIIRTTGFCHLKNSYINHIPR